MELDKKCPECGSFVLPLGKWYEPTAYFCPECKQKIPLWRFERGL